MILKKIATDDSYPLPINDALKFNTELLRKHQPDEHCVVLNDRNQVTARCSLWWKAAPPLPKQQMGIIGHFAADDKNSAVEILRQACERLTDAGCTLAVGPMDGSIWRSYRLVTANNGDAAFFLEPNTPLEWVQRFLDAGFSETATYFSAINSHLNKADPNIRRATLRLQREGIVIRNINPDDLQRELERIYEISSVSFRDSPFYTQLDQAEFKETYLGLKSLIEPELIFFAEQLGKPVGFIFALPDLLQAQRGQHTDCVIIKTVAVLPGRRYAGTGTVLIDAVRQTAHAMGYKKAIHALMREDGVSSVISSRTACPFRRYALYAKPLV